MNKFLATYTSGSKIINGLRHPITSTMEVAIDFQETNGEQSANIRYGFGSHYTQHSVKDPGCKRENYRLHQSVSPRAVHKLLHEPSGREFHFDNHEGFVCYQCDLIETATGKKVATIAYEDYYKD